MGGGRIFSRGALVDFFKGFLGWEDKNGEICFLPLETNKTAFFAAIFTFLTTSGHRCLCVGKVRAAPLKNWCNVKRFNTILKSEILLNLIHKMKYFTDQFQFCSCFCIGNTKQLYLFLLWQHNWHPYSRPLASWCICFVLAFRYLMQLQNEY